MSNVFISYAHEDKAVAQTVKKYLTEGGVSVWFDQSELKAGHWMFERIGSGIRNSDYFVVLLTPAAIESESVKLEINAAIAEGLRRSKRFVIPVLVKKCDIPPIILGKVYVDLSDQHSFDAGIRYLSDAVSGDQFQEPHPESGEVDRVFVLAGLTSAGKDALLTSAQSKLTSAGKHVQVINKYTTRSPRSGEKGGEATYYKFRDYKTIEELYAAGDIVWKYEKYGNTYGIENIAGIPPSGQAYVCIATMLSETLSFISKLNHQRLLVIPILITAPENVLRGRLKRRHVDDLRSRQIELAKDLKYLSENKEIINRIFQIRIENSDDVPFDRSLGTLIEVMSQYLK